MRRAWVTGASSGIGLATCQLLSAAGWDVLAGVRSAEDAACAAAAGWTPVVADLRDPETLREALGDALGDRTLDAIVANAGLGLFGAFEDCPAEAMQELLDVNVMGVWRSVQLALPRLRESRGRVVVLGSVAGRRGAPGSSVYAASKFALEGWAEGLSFELEPAGVAVTLIQPGPTRSRFLENRASIPGGEDSLYQPLLSRLEELLEERWRQALPASDVAAIICATLDHPSPPFRVGVGRDTKLQLTVSRLLPWGLYSRLVRWKLGDTRPGS